MNVAVLVARGNPTREARERLAADVQDALSAAGVEVDGLVLNVDPDVDVELVKEPSGTVA